MRFAIFTHVPHKIKKRQFYGYAPYIREMNLWFQYVEEVEVVAPLSLGMEISAEIPYQKSVFFTEIPSIDFLSIKRSFEALTKIPFILLNIYKAMKRADHIHLRCPGNIGLFACIVQIFFPKKPKTVKYAGNWDPNAEQPWSYKFQKWILSNTFLSRNMKVLVYGEWPHQSKNIIPFFTASFSEKEIFKAKDKNFTNNLTFLYVGNLVSGKQPLLAIKLIEKLREQNFQIFLEIYGDGVLREELEQYSLENHLSEFIHFKGNQTLETVKEAYKKAHFLVLPSKSEGWPKAVAEAMFFGCIPIATPVSCVPWMLGSPPAPKGGEGRGEGAKRGLIWAQIKNRENSKFQKPDLKFEEDKKEIEINVDKVGNLIKNPEKMKMMSKAAREWSQQYTLEKFKTAIKQLIS